MRAEIISVGTELLTGSILNTNQQYLAGRCATAGINIYRMVSVGDNPGRLAEALADALGRADIVITTGGLGPTADDITLETAANALGLPLVRDKKTHRAILAVLGNKRSRLTPEIARQALVPAGSLVFPNPFGTAPGLMLRVMRGGAQKFLLLLPGPPREMNPMFQTHALPRLARLGIASKESFVIRTLKIFGVAEAHIARRVDDLLRLPPPVTVGIYAKPGEVELKIMSKHRRRRGAQAAANRIETKILGRFPKYLILRDEETLESRLGALLRAKKFTCAAAESCTGGLIGHFITAVPGASDYFTGALVAYSDRVKTALLGVKKSLLRRHGAVSAETVDAMARGARRMLETDVGLATSGIAGPAGGSRRKPVGLVFVGFSSEKKSRVERFYFLGKREDIKLKAAKAALLLAVECLSGKTGRQADERLQDQIRV